MVDGVTLVYDGGVADRAIIDAKQFGTSLVGLDRIVNDGLILLTTGRPAQRRERFGFYLAVRQPRRGSFEVPTDIQEYAWLLPLLNEFVVSSGHEFLRTFVAWVLLSHGGRKSEAVQHMEKMIEMLREVNRSREVTDLQWQQTLLSVVDRLGPAAVKAVDPVGRSTDVLAIGDRFGKSRVIVDEPTAVAIRSKEELEVEEMQSVEFRIDGVIEHSRQLKVEFADQPKIYFTAEVRDPSFETPANPYKAAFAAGKRIRVSAKPVRKNGALHKLYVMDFEREVED